MSQFDAFLRKLLSPALSGEAFEEVVQLLLRASRWPVSSPAEPASTSSVDLSSLPGACLIRTADVPLDVDISHLVPQIVSGRAEGEAQ